MLCIDTSDNFLRPLQALGVAQALIQTSHVDFYDISYELPMSLSSEVRG